MTGVQTCALPISRAGEGHAALDAAHRGGLDDWYSAADWLQREGWISAGDAEDLRTLWWVGRYIGNTDMHFGNVSFRLDSARPLRMLPAYDMLPMHFRPAVSGEVITRPLVFPFAPPSQASAAMHGAKVALSFWSSAAGDQRVSPEIGRASCRERVCWIV